MKQVAFTLPFYLSTVDVPSECFDASWRAQCTIGHAGHGEVDWMIRSHYLHTWPAIETCVLAMRQGIYAVGVIVFAAPPPETEVRYGGDTWELARLWITDSVPRNAETWFIGKALKHVKEHHPHVKYIVSYADPAAGHCGIIYRASNWLNDGMTDDERKNPRCDYVANGTKYSRRAHVPVGLEIVRVPRVRKHRYLYCMNRKEHQNGLRTQRAREASCS